MAIECSENLSHVDSATKTLLTRLQSLFSANPEKLGGLLSASRHLVTSPSNCVSSDLLSASSTEFGSLLGQLKSGTVVDSGFISSVLTQSTSSDLLSALLVAAELGSLKLVRE